jgi:hypothetical protein
MWLLRSSLRLEAGLRSWREAAEAGNTCCFPAAELCQDPVYEFVDFVCRARGRQIGGVGETPNQAVHTGSIIWVCVWGKGSCGHGKFRKCLTNKDYGDRKFLQFAVNPGAALDWWVSQSLIRKM